MSALTSVLEQYEKLKSATSGNGGISQEERMKRYFTTVLPKGVKNAEKRIRILPAKGDAKLFEEINFHEVQVDGKWLKLYDPKQEGKRSPLNEVREGLEMSGLDSDKELAKMYRSRKFFIVKLIDRDNEQDGPKFWRFKYTTKGDGIFDKIVPIFRNKGDITDAEEGRDLILTLGLSKSNNGREYTTISSVIPEDKSPLHTDKAIAEEWMSNELTWSDVYPKKPEEYLEMVAKGEVPRWNNDLKKWVSNEQGEEVIGNGKTDTPITPDPQQDDEPDEDLPF